MSVAACARAASDTPIDAARIGEAVKTLGSDEFGGRGRGTPGEDRTVEYLVSTFKQIGLEPGGENGGWTQRVDLLHTQLGEPEELSVTVDGEEVPWTFAKDVYVSTLQPADRAAIDDAEMVFVRSEEHTSELQSLMRISYAVFCLKKKKKNE